MKFKKYLLLRLQSSTGEISGTENICSWKHRKKLKVSKTDVESYNPYQALNYLVKTQLALSFNLNYFRPYNFSKIIFYRLKFSIFISKTPLMRGHLSESSKQNHPKKAVLVIFSYLT